MAHPDVGARLALVELGLFLGRRADEPARQVAADGRLVVGDDSKPDLVEAPAPRLGHQRLDERPPRALPPSYRVDNEPGELGLELVLPELAVRDGLAAVVDEEERHDVRLRMPLREHRWAHGPLTQPGPARRLLRGQQPAGDDFARALWKRNQPAHRMSLAKHPHTAGVRVLFTCRPLTGHFRPLLPLAEACRRAGHEVAFATADPIAADAEREGFAAIRAGLGPESRLQLLERHPDFDAIPRSQLRATFFRELFVEIELEPRARALDAAVDEWGPDLLVHDVAEFAAPLVARRHGLPYATHGFGAAIPEPVVQAAAAAAAPIWRAFGLEPRPRAGLYENLYVDPCPPSLQEPDAVELGRSQQLRIVERALSPSDRTTWIRPDDDRLLVYVTLGTVWNDKREVFRAIVDGLAGLEVVAIVTVGAQSDPAALGELPPNVTAHRFIPQSEVLTHCAAAVVHGGSGTLLGALAEGVPLVLVPQGADQFSNSARVAAAGAGLELLPEAVSSARIRESVERLLLERSFTARAQQIADEIAALPSPSRALGALEALVDAGAIR